MANQDPRQVCVCVFGGGGGGGTDIFILYIGSDHSFGFNI